MRFYRRLTVASVLAFSVLMGFAADKPRVFVTGANGKASVSFAGDAAVAEGIKLFRKGCPSVEVTTQQDEADYIVGVTNSGSGAARRGRRVEVFTPEGAVVFASLTRRLKNAVKDACEAITNGRFPRVLLRGQLHPPLIHDDHGAEPPAGRNDVRGKLKRQAGVQIYGEVLRREPAQSH